MIPSNVPAAAPATTSLKKCMPRTIRLVAIDSAQKHNSKACSGYMASSGVTIANAVIVWPDGKLN